MQPVTSLSDILRLERQLWDSLDAESRIALRATSREVLYQTDQSVRMIEWGHVDDEESERLLVALLRRLPCLRVLKLHSLSSVEAVFAGCHDGSLCCPQLDALELSVRKASPSKRPQHGARCMHGGHAWSEITHGGARVRDLSQSVCACLTLLSACVRRRGTMLELSHRTS